MKPDHDNVHDFERAVSLQVIEMSGGYAVRVRPGQKEPAPGWDPRANNPAKSAQTITGLRKSNDNIGLHLHGSLVDVDVDGDGEFLLDALEHFLPPSSHVWGRTTRPRTHRLYHLRQAEKNFDPTQFPVIRRLMRIEAVKVEIRGGQTSRGEYSLLPGSIHPSGDKYEWTSIQDAQSTLTVVEPQVLIDAIRKAGAATIISPLWTEGIRQELTMALAGFLHRASSIGLSLSGEDGFAFDADTGLQFLEAVMQIAGDDPSDAFMRRKAFEATWKKAEAHVPVTGASTIEKLTGDENVVGQLYALLCDNPSVEQIDEFARQFAIWKGPALAVDLELVAKGEPRPFMSRRQFANSYGHRFVEGTGGRKLLPELLWSLSSAVRVNGLTFEPSEPDQIVSTEAGDKINQWIGFRTELPPLDESVAVQQFLDYMKRVVCNDDDSLYQWVLAWCADIFQYPSDKPGTALVLVGTEGVGKSFLGECILGPLIGSAHYAQTNNVENLTRNFNVAFANKVLIQCDEAINSRQKTHAARMKSLITDRTMTIEPKGVDQYFLPSHARILFTSNEIYDAVYMPSGNDDRRYTVVHVPATEKGRISEYWWPLAEWLKTENVLPSILKYLMEHKYDKRLIKQPYATDAKRYMQQQSWNVWDGWLASMIARNHPLSEDAHLFPYDAIVKTYKSRTIVRGWPTHVTHTALRLDYQKYMARQGRFANGANLNESQIGQRLQEQELIPPDGAIKRVKFSQYDERKGAVVAKQPRIYPAPRRDLIEAYLEAKYGRVAPPDTNFEDLEDEDGDG